jgi:glycosyltransferase involved in cell wall biosynthesis
VLSRIPELRLVCLFRGTLHEEWSNKVEAAGLVDRVEIIHEKTDVARILARCHAAIVLASKSDEVKSYPNSLMESLASGRPVLVSRVIPISFYIEDNDLGKVIEDLSLEALVPAVRELMDHYSSFRQAVDQRRRSDWSVQRMIEDYASLYRKVIE